METHFSFIDHVAERRARDYELLVSYGRMFFVAFFLTMLMFIAFSCTTQEPAKAEELKASWYSISSLKKEGTYAYSKGQMANGAYFRDDNFTCAARLFSLGSIIRVTNCANGKSVVVRVTDRIGKRFATKRIDLSKIAFASIADLGLGIIKVKIEKLGKGV